MRRKDWLAATTACPATRPVYGINTVWNVLYYALPGMFVFDFIFALPNNQLGMACQIHSYKYNTLTLVLSWALIGFCSLLFLLCFTELLQTRRFRKSWEWWEIQTFSKCFSSCDSLQTEKTVLLNHSQHTNVLGAWLKTFELACDGEIGAKTCSVHMAVWVPFVLWIKFYM